MSIKVLRIIARLNIGGPARNAVILTEGMKYDTVLVCGEIAKDEGDMMYLAEEKGIKPVIVKELGSKLSLKNDWMAFWKIYRIICREKPNIVHTHTAKAGTLGRSAALLYNLMHGWCKVVHTFHGHVLHSYFGRLKTLIFIWIEKVLALFTDRIITVSGSLKKELVEKYRIGPKEKFSVIELGFQLDELLGLGVNRASDCINIGIIGRFVPVKNHKMFFRLVKDIAHNGNSISQKVKFIVIGGGELSTDLKNYVKELEIEGSVEFKGWVKSLREIYEGLDIVALTSLNEGTPVSIIEAMAAAKPVVATEVGGVSDVVQEGKSGFLVESNNDEAFKERLLDLVKSDDKRKRFGEYGRSLVKERFSKDRLIKNTEELYEGLFKGVR